MGKNEGMRRVLSSGTPVDLATVANPTMGLVVIPDIWGLRPLFVDIIERFAHEWNMNVVAVEPFPGQQLSDTDVAPRMAAVPALDDKKLLADLVEAAELLNTTHVGLIGFCMGGMYCHKASTLERFERIVSFYGMITLPENWRSPTQEEPLACLLKGYGDSVLAVIGALDTWTPHGDVEQMRATGVNVVVYPEAEHGFAHDASRPAHRPDDARDAFERAKNWLLSATL